MKYKSSSHLVKKHTLAVTLYIEGQCGSAVPPPNRNEQVNSETLN